MNDVVSVLLLSTLGSLVALIGGVVFLYNKKWSKVLSRYSVPFAAGVLLTVSLVGLLPESVHMYGEGAFFVVLLTFFASFLFEQFVCHLHHHESHDHDHGVKSSSVPLVLVGDTIHNFIDGVAISASFLVNPGLGLITAISTLLHEVPHEIGDFGLLLKAGWKKGKVLLVTALSASMPIVGAMMVLVFTPSESTVGVLLAIAAGMFLYLGASDFLPSVHIHDKKDRGNVVALIIGVIVMYLTLNIIPHSHGEGHGASHEDREHEMHEEHDESEHEMEMEEEHDEHMHDEHDEHMHEDPVDFQVSL